MTPVITVAGPVAPGKGTVARKVAEALGFHLLDSGAIYRAHALACLSRNLDFNEINVLEEQAKALSLKFDGEKIWIDGADATEKVRSEAAGMAELNPARFHLQPKVFPAAIRQVLIAFDMVKFDLGEGGPVAVGECCHVEMFLLPDALGSRVRSTHLAGGETLAELLPVVGVLFVGGPTPGIRGRLDGGVGLGEQLRGIALVGLHGPLDVGVGERLRRIGGQAQVGEKRLRDLAR